MFLLCRKFPPYISRTQTSLIPKFENECPVKEEKDNGYTWRGLRKFARMQNILRVESEKKDASMSRGIAARSHLSVGNGRTICDVLRGT
jgi:hypothetical protein